MTVMDLIHMMPKASDRGTCYECEKPADLAIHTHGVVVRLCQLHAVSMVDEVIELMVVQRRKK